MLYSLTAHASVNIPQYLDNRQVYGYIAFGKKRMKWSEYALCSNFTIFSPAATRIVMEWTQGAQIDTSCAAWWRLLDCKKLVRLPMTIAHHHIILGNKKSFVRSHTMSCR